MIFYVDIINHYTVSTTGWRRNENAKYLRALTIYLKSESFFFSKALLKETEQSEIYCDESLEVDMGICVVAMVLLICFVQRCGE